jgi:hypothetical protein
MSKKTFSFSQVLSIRCMLIAITMTKSKRIEQKSQSQNKTKEEENNKKEIVLKFNQ